MNGSLDERFWSKVEKTEGCWNWTASLNRGGYSQYKFDGKIRSGHRLVYSESFGGIPAGMFVDHACHNRACVNPAHLRLATRKQNGENRIGAASSNRSSGVRGVTWHKATGAWRGYVGHFGKHIHVGRFASIAEAEAAVIAKRLELFTHNDADRIAA